MVLYMSLGPLFGWGCPSTLLEGRRRDITQMYVEKFEEMHRDSEVGHKADIDNISIILYMWPGREERGEEGRKGGGTEERLGEFWGRGRSDGGFGAEN